MYNARKVKAKDLKAGDSIALLLGQQYHAITKDTLDEDTIERVELVDLFDILSATHMKLSKTVAIEIQKEAVKGKESEPIAHVLKAEQDILLVEPVEKVTPKKSK